MSSSKLPAGMPEAYWETHFRLAEHVDEWPQEFAMRKTRTGTAFWLVAKSYHRRGSTFRADQSKAAVRNSCSIKASPLTSRPPLPEAGRGGENRKDVMHPKAPKRNELTSPAANPGS